MAKLTEFEQKVCDWLSKPAAERDLEEGAKLLLQISRNKILHQNVIRKENFDKIEYVLRNYMGDKAPESTEQKVDNEELADFNKEFEKIISINVGGTGKREDHDQLPDFIQAIPEKNTAIYQKMRSLQERLKILSSGASTAADRLPFVTELLELDSELTANWEAYDSFDLASYDPNKKVERLDIKQVQSARTYLSRAAAKETLNEKALEETQIRYNDLILDGQTVSPEITEKLKALGVIVMEVKETEEIEPKVEITEKDIAAAVINSEKEEIVEETTAEAVSETKEEEVIVPAVE